MSYTLQWWTCSLFYHWEQSEKEQRAKFYLLVSSLQHVLRGNICSVSLGQLCQVFSNSRLLNKLWPTQWNIMHYCKSGCKRIFNNKIFTITYFKIMLLNGVILFLLTEGGNGDHLHQNVKRHWGYTSFFCLFSVYLCFLFSTMNNFIIRKKYYIPAIQKSHKFLIYSWKFKQSQLCGSFSSELSGECVDGALGHLVESTAKWTTWKYLPQEPAVNATLLTVKIVLIAREPEIEGTSGMWQLYGQREPERNL